MNEQAKQRTLTKNKRVILWRLWNGDPFFEWPNDMLRDDALVAFDPPRLIGSATWRDAVLELAEDGYVDAQVSTKTHRLLAFRITGAGLSWATNYFTRTKAGRVENTRHKEAMKEPLAKRDPRAKHRSLGGHSKPPAESSVERLFNSARAIGVADGDDVVVYQHGDEPMYARLGAAGGWSRRTVSVIISGLERNGDPRVKLTRGPNRQVLNIRFVGIGGGLTFDPDTVEAVQQRLEGTLAQPGETDQRVRPEPMDDPIPHITAMVAALGHAFQMAYDVVRAERDEALALLESATSPSLDPAIREIIEAAQRIRLSQ